MNTQYPKGDIKQLNSFLRGEISAVETYEQALTKADSPRTEAILRANKDSHAARATALNTAIRGAGGEPAESSGVWGAFAKATAGGAKLFGETAAVAALEEGEDHGLKEYRSDLDDLSPAAKTLVTTKLLPEQQRTHDALSGLKQAMS